jgi:hypothetical protein
MASARWAECEQHGGRYEVLFDRNAAPQPLAEAPAAPSMAAVAALSMCAAHPRQQAVAACPSCGKQLCALCTFDVAGRRYCSDCAIAQATAPKPPPPAAPVAQPGMPTCPHCGLALPPGTRQCNCGYTSGLLNLTLSPGARPAATPLGPCAGHPQVEATARCRVCTKTVCATCDFSWPGDLHFCPDCVERSSTTTEVDPARKRNTYIAIALASWSTILMVMMFGGAFQSLFEDPDTGKVADFIITNAILWPLLFGTGLSISAVEPKLQNTGLMKAVMWWNGVLLAVMMLLVVGANLGVLGQ